MPNSDAVNGVGIGDASSSLGNAYNLGTISGRTVITGSVGGTDTGDVYRLTPQSSLFAAFALNNLTEDLDLLLFDSNGNQIEQSMNYGIRAESFGLFLSAGSTYYVKVQPFGASSYSLAISAGNSSTTTPTPTPTPTSGDDYSGSSSTTGRVNVGGSTAGRIETVGDHDWFAVTLNAGTSYTIRQDAASGSTLDSYLELRNSSGTSVASDDDGGGNFNSLITYTPTTSGTYYLDTRGYGSTIGNYSVSVAGSGTTTPTPTPTTTTSSDIGSNIGTSGYLVVNGGLSTGSIQFLGDHDWFAVTLNAGRNYTIQENSLNSNLDTYLVLRNSNGTEITYNDDYASGTDSLITYTPTVTGIYYVDAGSFRDHGTGAYSVSILW